jgi:MFS family permease
MPITATTKENADDRARADGFIDARGRREFAVVALSSLLFSITTTHSTLVAVALGHEGYSLRAIGVLISAVGVTALAATLGSGFVAARLGAVGAFRLAMALAAVGVASLAFTRGMFWPALASRLVWGAGVGLFLGPVNLYIQSRINKTRFVYLVTAFSSTIPLALAVAPPVGEWVLNHFGETALFIEGGVPAALALLITIGIRPLPPPPRPAGLGIAAAWRGWHPLPVATLVLGGAQFGYVASYLAPELREQGITLGWFFIPMTAVMIGCRVGAMRRLSALHPRTLAASGLITGGLSLAAASAATLAGPWMVVLAGALLGYGNSMMFPIMSAWLGRWANPTEGPGVQAIVSTAFYFGIYWTPSPIAGVIEFAGYSGAEWLLAISGLVLGVWLIVSRVDGGGDSSRAT